MDGKWKSWEIRNVVVLLISHLLCLMGPYYYNAEALAMACILGPLTGLFRITLCYHRCLTHGSFKLPKWLEYLFAYLGVLAIQGDPMEWVSTHRYHHKFADTQKDPHSPIFGFWFSHVGWVFHADLFYEKRGRTRRDNIGDLETQAFYRFLRQTHIFHVIALVLTLYALGGLPFIIWGMGVRIVYSHHTSLMVNSVCHVWGKRVWNTKDLSRNNWFVAIVTFGEGRPNNHHAFQYSARHGLEWWEIDATWYVIRFLEAIGLATDVQQPNESQKRRISIFNNAVKDC